MGCVASGRHATFDSLKRTHFFVVNIPMREWAKQGVGIGSCPGRVVDQFTQFGFAPVAAKQVQTPLIGESRYASDWMSRGGRLADHRPRKVSNLRFSISRARAVAA